VTVSVTCLNDFPVAVDDSTSTAKDTAVNIPVLDNDSDVDVGHYDALIVMVASDPAYGTALVKLDGRTITFTPEPDFHGIDFFTYTVDDGDGGTGGPATVTVTVLSVNDAPIAAPDFVSMSSIDGEIDINVLANDSDVDGHTLYSTIMIPPNSGTCNVSDHGFTKYTPHAKFCGMDNFIYLVEDGHGGNTTGNVTVEVKDMMVSPFICDICHCLC